MDMDIPQVAVNTHSPPQTPAPAGVDRPRIPFPSSKPTQSGHDVPASSAPNRPACRECRARKVRCDRASPGCGPCARFDLACSYAGPGATGSDAAVDAGVTEAGLARRRSRRACGPCRALKTRCSGQLPCARCRLQGLSCGYRPRGAGRGIRSPDAALAPASRADHVDAPSPAIRARSASPLASAPPNGPSQPRVLSLTTQSGTPHSHSLPAPTSSAYTRLTEDSSRALEDIKAFFRSSADSPAVIQFLHRSSVLADWSQGRLDVTLAATLCALGRLSASEATPSFPGQRKSREDEVGARDARAWLGEAQKAVVERSRTATLVQLQTLILIMQHCVMSGDVMDAWSLVALGARLAFTLRLNYELPGWDHDPVAQETRRRMIWSIWLIDRLLAGGIEDLVVCPTERIHVRLPCDDYTFQRGVTSRAGRLTCPVSQVDDTGQDTLGYYLRLLESRHQILRYTKAIVRESAPPVSSAGTLHALQSDLLSLENSLPSDLKLSQERLRLKAHSRDVGVYVALHMLWNQCHCDLYRFLVPGMREAVRSDIFKDTPAEYIAHCQMACLLAAIRATNLLADLYRLGFRKACNIPNLAVGIHQVTQILYRLQHLLQPPNSSPHGVDTIKTSLTDARSMVSILQPSARLGTKVVEILAETDALIQELGNDAPLSQDLESSGPRTILDTAQPGAGHDPWPGSAQHPASKGSFLDDIERQTNTAGQMATTVEGPAADTTSCYNTEGRTSNNTSPQDAPGYISEDRASQERQAGESLMSLQYGMANPPPGLMAGNMDPWASTDRLLDQRRPTEGNIPWDPFEVQLYDYYDAGLEMVLFSLSAA